ncbi:hypothetical protein GW17_00017909 [Ensete ventricosum]|nr:hypothetical protein GW17_00017909 [Ensete ventricosum]RZS15243.1 hypothetical protein BHM03_00047061 [Ensete ventricosum]
MSCYYYGYTITGFIYYLNLTKESAVVVDDLLDTMNVAESRLLEHLHHAMAAFRHPFMVRSFLMYLHLHFLPCNFLIRCHLFALSSEEPGRFKSFMVDFSHPKFSSSTRDVWSTASAGDRVVTNERHGVLDAPTHAALLHGTHPCYQGPLAGNFCSPVELPPGEVLAGVSNSSCALSLLSTHPWSSNSAGNPSVIPANSTFDVPPPSTCSVIPGNSTTTLWGLRGHGGRTIPHEIQHKMGLAEETEASNAHISGQVGFAPHENGQRLDHGSGRAFDHSVPGMHWSL